jgi:type IV pilus assembly protein PilW
VKTFIPVKAPRRATQSGFSLIELMIALLLGLLVVAAAAGVFMSNKRVYAATETLGRIQENSRAAFEIMSRDVREAGGNPCSSAASVVNQLVPGSNSWWAGFGDGLEGFDDTVAMPATAFGTTVGTRISGTDAVQLHLARDGSMRVLDHDTPGAVLTVNDSTGVAVNDILMICNMNFAFIFQVTALPSGNIQHAGGSGSSLNCSQEFQSVRPDDGSCWSGGASAGNGYCFTEDDSPCDSGSFSPAYVARINSMQWYVGANDRGGRSLFRARVANQGSGLTPTLIGNREEIVEGVENMQLEYFEAGDSAYGAETTVADWGRVTAVRIRLQMTGTQGSLVGGEIRGQDGQVIDRFMTHVINIRNREDLL